MTTVTLSPKILTFHSSHLLNTIFLLMPFNYRLSSTQAELVLSKLSFSYYLPLGVLATRQGDRDLGAKAAPPPIFPPIPSLIKYGAVSTKSVGGGGCVGKTQLPNVLVNIHKNTSVLLNPRQTIPTRPCALRILWLLILLSALNSFPQLLLPPSCVSELLPAP